jgi:hypothetical protein
MLMLPVLLSAYVAICAAMAYSGRNTRIGALILFLVGLLVTPIVPAIYILVARIEQKT